MLKLHIEEIRLSIRVALERKGRAFGSGRSSPPEALPFFCDKNIIIEKLK
ncbi:MAG: hypothetical protein K2G52_06795 [Muribaculaceae bacterium]|nr:hypothetical protein [Muribaculaceae bacterium]